MPTTLNQDSAYTARKTGGHAKPGSSVNPVMEDGCPMTSLDERAYTNAGPVGALLPKRIANIADFVATVAVAFSGLNVSSAFTAKATATEIDRYGLVGALPTGLTIAASTGLVSGTPAAGTAGVYNLQGYAECDSPEAIIFSNHFKLTVNP
jgi:hypothetical protein